MKKSLIVLLCMLFLGLLVMVTACSGKDEHGLIVRLDDKVIRSVSLDDADGNDLFKSNFKRDNLDNSMLVEFGDKIYLDFGDSMPDRVVVQDYLLTSAGEYMYKQMAGIIITCERDENGFYVVVEKHPASAFSSVIEEDRKDHRGFVIRASWDNDEIIYGFVIKTKSII